jgi:hypothetical protein
VFVFCELFYDFECKICILLIISMVESGKVDW